MFVVVKCTVNLSKIADNNYINEISEQFKDNNFILELKSLINSMDNLSTSYASINQFKDSLSLLDVKPNYETLKRSYEKLENTRTNVILNMNKNHDKMKDNHNMLIQTELYFMFQMKNNLNILTSGNLILIKEDILNNILKELPDLDIYNEFVSQITNLNILIDISNKNINFKKYLLKLSKDQQLEPFEENYIIENLNEVNPEPSLLNTWWKSSSSKSVISKLICNYTFYSYIYYISVLNKIRTCKTELINNFKFIHINNKLEDDNVKIEYSGKREDLEIILGKRYTGVREIEQDIKPKKKKKN